MGHNIASIRSKAKLNAEKWPALTHIHDLRMLEQSQYLFLINWLLCLHDCLMLFRFNVRSSGVHVGKNKLFFKIPNITGHLLVWKVKRTVVRACNSHPLLHSQCYRNCLEGSVVCKCLFFYMWILDFTTDVITAFLSAKLFAPPGCDWSVGMTSLNLLKNSTKHAADFLNHRYSKKNYGYECYTHLLTLRESWIGEKSFKIVPYL